MADSECGCAFLKPLGRQRKRQGQAPVLHPLISPEK